MYPDIPEGLLNKPVTSYTYLNKKVNVPYISNKKFTTIKIDGTSLNYINDKNPLLSDLSRVKGQSAYKLIPNEIKELIALTPEREALLLKHWVTTVRPNSIAYGGYRGYQTIFLVEDITLDEVVFLSKMISPNAVPFYPY